MARRIERIDALRGLAVFGIMLVNVWGFVYGFTLYSVAAPESLGPLDQAALFFVAAFAEQKFYPIFAFLFGAGFALQTGGRRRPGPPLDAIAATYRRRLSWLLVCGILHGTLVWFGDILTAYALIGFWLVTKAGRRLSELVASACLLAVVNGMLIGGMAAFELLVFEYSMEDLIARARDTLAEHAAFTQGSWGDAAVARLRNYGINVASLAIFGPFLALLMLLGVLAVRLGWLTRPERHRRAWRRVLAIGLAVGLPFNIWWGLVAVRGVLSPYAPPAGLDAGGALLQLGGPGLAAAIVATFMLAREGFCAWLVPLGKMALTNYLTQSIVLMLLLQGFGLGLGAALSPAPLILVCLAIFLGQLLFCRWWLSAHSQGPVEAMWRRYTYSK